MAFVAAIGWVCALASATVAASRHHIGLLTYGMSAVYVAGAIVCHQLPARSFQMWGAQWPVCARCTGIYAGAVLGTLLASAWNRPDVEQRAAAHARSLVAFALAPTLLTLAYEWLIGVVPSNAVRAASGLHLGALVSWLLVTAASPRASVEIH